MALSTDDQMEAQALYLFSEKFDQEMEDELDKEFDEEVNEEIKEVSFCDFSMFSPLKLGCFVFKT